MPNKKKDSDVFLDSVGEVEPLKKNNKKYNKPIRVVKNFKIIKKSETLKKTKETNKPEENNYKKMLNLKPTQFNKKLKKGKVPINKKIDFHGLSYEEAKSLFFNTVEECFYSNKRCILCITGKGISKNNNNTQNKKLFYGKIREGFLSWVYENEMQNKILNVTPASFSHGGDGAFFIYLRKKKN